MESKEKIEQFKKIENELRGILQGNKSMDPKLIILYRDLLHKTRIERLTLQVETLSIKSVCGTIPARKPMTIKPGLFNAGVKVASDQLSKNIEALKKSQLEVAVESIKKINKDTRERHPTRKTLEEFRKKKLGK